MRFPNASPATLRTWPTPEERRCRGIASETHDADTQFTNVKHAASEPTRKRRRGTRQEPRNKQPTRRFTRPAPVVSWAPAGERSRWLERNTRATTRRRRTRTTWRTRCRRHATAGMDHTTAERGNTLTCDSRMRALRRCEVADAGRKTVSRIASETHDAGTQFTNVKGAAPLHRRKRA